ncbi:HAD family hydrolase [Streptomyces sp. NPDC048523]|uniref:HAD family hydrolase n=1 Tax=Streptomyces sp. NPDC048523 TaxID=3365567 RepID=UPI003718F837
MTKGIAFFDVDETLLAEKSMLSFWKFWMRRQSFQAAQPRTSGADRAQLNREYFRLFAGVSSVALEQAAWDWYAEYRQGDTSFLMDTLQELDGHRQAGRDVLLVSGSSPVLLAPVAQDVGADGILATEQIVDSQGVLTGEVRQPMIGPAKQSAVTTLLRDRGVDARGCFAYGDDSSDLPLLSLVGTPVVVGGDPVLGEQVRSAGWRRLPARPGPRRQRAPS